MLTPVFVILLLRDQLVPALAVFTLAGISDGIDGLIARWLDQQTILGAYLDPVADKVLLDCAFACLVILGIVPEWLAEIVLSRDILIVIGIVIFTLTEKRVRMRPSAVSKCTTAKQIVFIIVSLMVPTYNVFRSLQIPLLWLTAALTVISGFHCVYLGMQVLHQEGDPR